jgi:hypothetical protein
VNKSGESGSLIAGLIYVGSIQWIYDVFSLIDEVDVDSMESTVDVHLGEKPHSIRRLTRYDQFMVSKTS